MTNYSHKVEKILSLISGNRKGEIGPNNNLGVGKFYESLLGTREYACSQ